MRLRPTLLLVLGAAAAAASPGPAGGPLFREATFEELAAVTISSVSKRPEDYFRTAAAVHVITAEEIRRSGAPSLPEALRLAPGVEVGAINSRTHAITVRGFNGSQANKLLPLIDGRSLYSLRFAGTIWDIRSLPLDEVAQIEVIGGPGGTTWGANAVNGVINIITRSARETLGSHVALSAGSFHESSAYVRHGFGLGDDTWARVYIHGFRTGASEPVNLRDNNDAWGLLRAGLRVDRETADSQALVTADVFDGRADQLIAGVPGTARSRGGHVLARYRREWAGGGAWRLQAWHDHFDRDSGGNSSQAATSDVDFLSEHPWREHTLFTWGGNVRRSRLEDTIELQGIRSFFDPATRNFNQGAAFVQGDFRLTPNVTAVGGFKFEYNDFTRWEALPSLRLAWAPTPGLTLWTAASRASRIPSRFEREQFLVLAGPGPQVRSVPSPDLRSEELHATELGLRWRPAPGWAVDLTLFRHSYDHLVTNISRTTPTSVDSSLENRGLAQSCGLEWDVTWQPATWLQLRLFGNWLDLDTEVEAGSPDTALALAEVLSPNRQVGLRSSLNLPRRWELDLTFRHVAELPRVGQLIPAYSNLDVRLGKQLGGGWEVSVVGHNLLDGAHREFRFFTTQAAVARGYFLRLDWRR